MRGEFVSDPLRTPHAAHGLDDFERETRAFLDAAAIGIGAPVEDVAKELVEQTRWRRAIRAVESAVLAFFRRSSKLTDNACNSCSSSARGITILTLPFW
jgi:hypothetical protein